MMRLEEEFLLLCARTVPDPATSASIKAIAKKDMDWDYLLQTAMTHGVAPLIYWNLNSLCSQDIPTPILNELRTFLFNNAQRNLLLARELLDLSRFLNANGFPSIPFKGPLLAIHAYGNISLRQIADLDFIVHKRDARGVKDLLLKEGFFLAHPMDRVQEEIFLRANCEFTFQRDHPPLVVDVHWGIVPKYFYFPFDMEEIWHRLVPVKLAGATIFTLGPEDLVLILCVHGARHVWERLDWICSVSEVVRTNPNLNWDQVTERAESLGAKRMLLLGLVLAEQLLGTELPSGIEQKIQSDPVVAFIAARIRSRLFRDKKRDRGFFDDMFVDELHPRMFDRLQHRARYYAYLFFSPTVGDTLFLRLPSFLFFAYYLIRPIRLIAIFGPKLLKSKLHFV